MEKRNQKIYARHRAVRFGRDFGGEDLIFLPEHLHKRAEQNILVR